MNETQSLSSLASMMRPQWPQNDRVASSPLFAASDYSFGEDGEEEEPRVISVGDFLSRFRDYGSESLCNAYQASRPHNTAFNSGVVTTTLCEDIFSLVNLQINALHDYLEGLELLRTRTGDTVLLDGLLFIFRNLWYKQRHYRDTFLLALKSSCAAANDFQRMAEQADRIIAHVRQKYKHLQWDTSDGYKTEISQVVILSEKMSDLVRLYSSDAVIAAQRVHVFLFQSVNRSSIKEEIFGRDWEENLTHNQLALSLVKTLEDYLFDTQQFLGNDFLYIKAVDALVKATVCFYVRCLVQKADSVRRRMRNFTAHGGRLPFRNPSRALSRIMYDIDIIHDYFQDLAKESSALARVVEQEFSILIALQEFLGVAVGKFDAESLEHLILVLHKRTGGNVMVTTYLLGDMWFLFAPSKDKTSVSKTIELMKSELELMSKHMNEVRPQNHVANQVQSTGLMMDEMLKDIYEERWLQEATICGQVVRSMNDSPSVEARQETEIKFPAETVDGVCPKVFAGQSSDAVADVEWLDISNSSHETKEDRQSKPIEEFGSFVKEKLQELSHIGNARR